MTGELVLLDNAENIKSKFHIKPVLIFWIYWFWLFFRNAIVDEDKNTFYLPHVISKISYIVDPLIIFLMIFFLILLPKVNRRYFAAYIYFFAFVGIYAISIFANIDNINFLSAISFLLGYMQIIVLAMFVFRFASYIDYEQFLKIFTAMMFFQLVMNLGWLLKINPFKNIRRYTIDNVDWAYGTLASCNEIAGISSILIFLGIYSCLYLRKKRVWLWKFRWLFIGTGLFLMMFADSKLTFGSIALGSMLTSLLIFKGNPIKKGLVAISGLAIFVSFLYIGGMIYEYISPTYGSVNRYFTRLVAIAWDSVVEQNPKIRVFNSISKDLPNIQPLANYLGGGPGNVASRFAIKNKTELADKFMISEIDWVRKARANTVLLLPNTACNAIFGDLGWLGILIFYGMHCMVFITVGIGIKNGIYKRNVYLDALAFSYCFFSAYYIIHSFIDDQNYLGIQLGFFWTVGPLLLAHGNYLKLNEKR